MEKKPNGWLRLRNSTAVVILTIMVCVFGVGTYLFTGALQEYRDNVIDNQKNQLLLTTQALARSMAGFWDNMESEIDTLCDAVELFRERGETGEAQDLMLQAYYREHDHLIKDIRITAADGETLFHLGNTYPKTVFHTGMLNGKIEVRQGLLESGRPFISLGRSLGPGKKLWLVVDLMDYYKKLIGDIQLGTNGYILVKNSEGRILMHPSPKQWGINVIDDRKEMFPGVNLKSLREVIDEQNKGGTGVEEYDSYWWMDPKLPRVHKVGAWAPVKLGDDFLVISAVLDYSDIDVPMAHGLARMGVLFLAFTVVMTGLIIGLSRLLRERSRSRKKIAYLKELNDLLEKLHKSEENLGHQQRLQLIGTMTGGIAHEFNNLLTPIIGHAELLEMEMPEGSEQRDSVLEILDAAERAQEIIQQLASMSRKNTEVAFQRLEATAVFGRILKTVSSVCPRDVAMPVDLMLRDAFLMGSETQLQQVVFNICINAFHAMAKSGGTLRVTGRIRSRDFLREAGLLPDAGLGEHYIVIDFEDTGCGMSSATLEQIFDPFFTTKTPGQGTGLGLSLVQQIVRAHHGAVFAESRLGKGSVFHVVLPASFPGETDSERVLPEGETYRFLLVGGNAKILDAMRRRLEENGIHVTVASWRQAPALLPNSFEVLLADAGQETEKALELCAESRAGHPGRVHILLAERPTREIFEAKQRGILQGVLEKPVTEKEVLRLVHKLYLRYYVGFASDEEHDGANKDEDEYEDE